LAGTGPAPDASNGAAVRHCRAALLLVLLLLLSPTPSFADDAFQSLGRVEEPVGLAPPVQGLLRILTPDVAAKMDTQPSFLKDSNLVLHLRTYYFDKVNSNGSINEAWAGGGWLEYQSGQLFGHFSLGVVGYTSQPIYAPDDHGGSGLLAPGQHEITVLGQAYGRFRYASEKGKEPYAILTGYRQLVDDGYVNPSDSRMIPNTFEGVTLGGRFGLIAYNVGYLWDMKPRNSDEFISMSDRAVSTLPAAQQAAASGPDEGLVLASVLVGQKNAIDPPRYLQLGNYYVPDLFNTAFGQTEWQHSFKSDSDRKLSIALQYTDQRSVGDDRLGIFNTRNAGARVQYQWKAAANKTFTLEGAGHVTSDDATIKSPYGTWPGYLSLLLTDFNRAGEKAWGGSAKYAITLERTEIPAPTQTRIETRTLSFFVAYAQGTDRRDPPSGKSLPTTREIDVDASYKHERKLKDAPRPEQMAELRLRAGFMDDGVGRLSYQLRLIFNYEIDLL
jgi:hypothetical protein